MQINSRWVWTLAALAVIGAIVVAMIVRRQTDFGNAAQVIALPALTEVSFTASQNQSIVLQPYHWLDVNHIALTEDAPPSPGFHHRGPRTHVNVIIDVTAKHPMSTAQPLTGLPSGMESGYSPSPDGDRLLMTTAPGHPGLMAFSRSGKPTVYSSASKLECRYAWWSRDGSGWYECFAQAPNKMTVWYRPLAAPAETHPRGQIILDTDLNAQMSFAGIDDRGYIILDGLDTKYQPAMVKLDATGRQPAVRLPMRNSTRDVCASPNGKRLAWLFVDTDGARMSWKIAVSQSDGTGYRVISSSRRMSRPPDDGSSVTALNEMAAKYLQWRPDGNAVSILYQQKLYVIPCRDGSADRARRGGLLGASRTCPRRVGRRFGEGLLASVLRG